MTFHKFDPMSVLPDLLATDREHAEQIEQMALVIRRNSLLIHQVTEYEQNVVALIQHMERDMAQLHVRIQLLEARLGSSGLGQ